MFMFSNLKIPRVISYSESVENIQDNVTVTGLLKQISNIVSANGWDISVHI
jgi:hypothetical protein